MSNTKDKFRELLQHEDEIIDMYVNQKKSTYEIAKIFDTYGPQIRHLLLRSGIELRNYSESNRKYDVDITFFDVIDTEEKAYILGFLYADGCNVCNGRCVKLGLWPVDEEVLVKMQEASHNYSLIGHTTKVVNGTVCCTSTLNWNSKHIAETLAEKGLVQNKTMVLEFPKWLDKKLYSHFIRGYFDGDGSISFKHDYHKYYYHCSITSTLKFVSYVKDYLEQEFGLYCTITKAVLDGSNDITHNLRISRQKDVGIFLDFIYKDAHIYMERKYRRYCDFLATRDN